MSKRDYKSYNVLGEELAQEGIYGESEYTKDHEVDIESINEAKNDVDDIWQTHIIDVSPDAVWVDEIGKEQKDFHREETVNKDIDINDKINNSKDVKMNEEQESVDMTFLGYKNYYQTKERSKLVKWSLTLGRIILLIMLLPLITVIASISVLFIGGFLTAIILPIGTGIIILGAICFMSTQVNASLVALGISASVTAISVGGILFVLFSMLMKWIIGLFKRYKKSRNQSMKKEER